MKILLVNPPIYDFAAYDFWLKPFGMLRVAGMLRHRCDLSLFDYMDRRHPSVASLALREDRWGRGSFPVHEIPKPKPLRNVPRRYKRYGLPRNEFRDFLHKNGPFDIALIQTVMTYWYPGVQEVLSDLAEFCPKTKTVLGGVYATLCPAHAKSLGVDLVVKGSHLQELWDFLRIEPDHSQLPFWDGYPELNVGVLKLANGCPFRCTYCSVPQVEPTFAGHPLERSLAELEHLVALGAKHVAFYDDALLYQRDRILLPFLREVRKRNIAVTFHTPNALNARFITAELAEAMVQGVFCTFYLGFESNAYEWQRKTGGKVYSHELIRAVDNLVAAGASRDCITAYLIAGHPHGDQQEVEASMRFANEIGIRVMLAEFSPIPGTPDGEACRKWVDLDEPLWHNKTVFPIVYLGEEEVNRLKRLQRELNKVVPLAG